MISQVPKCKFCKTRKATHIVYFGKIDGWRQNEKGRTIPDTATLTKEFVLCYSCRKHAEKEIVP